MTGFSFARMAAVLRKEWLQMRRDRATVALTVACAADPAVPVRLCHERQSATPAHRRAGSRPLELHARTGGGAGEHRVFRPAPDELGSAGRAALATGEVMFVLNIPPGFSRDVDRGEHPEVLLDADGTDPTAIGNAAAAAAALNSSVLNRDLPPNMQSAPDAAAVPGDDPCPLQPGADHRAEHRAGADRHHPDDSPLWSSPPCRSPANAKPARWRICWRCRCVRSR